LSLYVSQSTQKAYRSGLRGFLGMIYPDPVLSLDLKAEKYLQEKRNVEEDIQQFNTAISDIPLDIRFVDLDKVQELIYNKPNLCL